MARPYTCGGKAKVTVRRTLIGPGYVWTVWMGDNWIWKSARVRSKALALKQGKRALRIYCRELREGRFLHQPL